MGASPGAGARAAGREPGPGRAPQFEASLKAAVLLLAVFLSAGPARATDWPQLQRDASRSGYSPDAVGVPPSGQCAVKWRWHPDKVTSVSGKVQPVVSNGTLCVGFYDGRMFALDALTGAPKWAFQAGGPIVHTAAMDATKVYFGAQDGFLYALNLGDGSLAWKVDTGEPIHNAVCLANGRIFVGNSGGKFFAFNANGTPAWVYDCGRPILTSAACANGRPR